jgi:hypothetical protein
MKTVVPTREEPVDWFALAGCGDQLLQSVAKPQLAARGLSFRRLGVTGRRVGMKISLVLTFALCLVPVAVAQHAPDQGTVTGDAIHGTGCVQPGVEHGCTMLKDKKTGDVYTLFFSGDAPPPYTGISFEGAPHQGMTTCMQGRAVDVSKWTKVKMRCKKSKSTEAAQ